MNNKRNEDGPQIIPIPIPVGKAKQQCPPRLPDGSVFHVAYFAGRGRWVGSLEANGQVYHGCAKSVFGLLTKLDRMYRESLIQPHTPA